MNSNQAKLIFNYDGVVTDDEYNQWEITIIKKKKEIEPRLKELLIKSDEDNKSRGSVRINKHLLEAFKLYTKTMNITAEKLLDVFIKDYILNNDRAKSYI